MTHQYFLGMDVGGTKTHALIADENGQALGFSAGGSGNWQSVGFDGQRAVVQQITQAALGSAGLSTGQLSGAGFGIAGFDWPSQLEAHLEVIQTLGLACPYEVTNDSVIGLLAGASQGWGVGVVAGTGNNCRGRDRSGREGRITGEGVRFGEYGGAAEIVMKAVQAVTYQWSQRGPTTTISEAFLELSGATDLLDLIEGIDLERYQPQAAWALRVFQAANEGDAVACEIIEWAARELGESACAVIRQLKIESEEFEVVLAGSIFEGGEIYVKPLQETILRLAPNVKFVRMEAPPVVGGVVLAMQKAGLDTAAIHRNLIQSTRKFLDNRA